MGGDTTSRGGLAVLKNEDGDGRGQSEVIGVILMVAIVVVLAAVIGQYVFGLDIVQGGEQAVGPQISFDTEVEPSSGDLVIKHQSGDSVETSELSIIGSDGTIVSKGNDTFWNSEGVKAEWTSGESITISSSELTSGETIRIIWESSTTSDSTVVLKYEYDP